MVSIDARRFGFFLRGGKYLDQALWAIVDEDWRESKDVKFQKGVGGPRVH